MSLLNDALRKRRQENAGHQQRPATPAPIAVSGHRRPRATWLAAVALAAGGLSIPLWQTAGTHELSPPPLKTVANPPSGLLSQALSAPAGPPPAALPPSAANAPSVPTATDAPPASAAAEGVPKPKPAAARPPRPARTRPAKPAAEESPFYTKAKALHRQQRYREAIGFYRQALALNPDHAACRFNLATAYLASDAFGDAYPLLMALAASAPSNPDIQLNLAIAEIGAGRLEAAAVSLETAQGLPAAPLFEIHFHHGILHGRCGRPQAAIASYRRAMALKPGHSGVLLNLALTYDRLAHYPEALDYYLRSLAAGDGLTAQESDQIRRRIRQLQSYLSTAAEAAPDRHLSSAAGRPQPEGR
ncbi:MAG: tetratricopeptide repeat protein [Desulfobacteraceae bacterium]|nr:tetratricopeptide repeat protein [Desulfobacteraceae bacterium]